MASVPRLHEALNALVAGIANQPGLTRAQIVAGAELRGWDGTVIGPWVDALAETLFEQGATDAPGWNAGVRPRALALGGERAAKALLKAIHDLQGVFSRLALLARAAEAEADATTHRARADVGDVARLRLLATSPADPDLVAVLDVAGLGIDALRKLAALFEQAAAEARRRADV